MNEDALRKVIKPLVQGIVRSAFACIRMYVVEDEASSKAPSSEAEATRTDPCEVESDAERSRAASAAEGCPDYRALVVELSHALVVTRPAWEHMEHEKHSPCHKCAAEDALRMYNEACKADKVLIEMAAKRYQEEE